MFVWFFFCIFGLEPLINYNSLIFQARAESPKIQPFTVVIDPGHGGDAFGAVSVTGFKEADYVLEIAQLLKNQFQNHPNIQLILTRESDVEVSLRDRAKIANDSRANAFISIHANAATSQKLRGIETYSINVASDTFSQVVANRENDTQNIDINKIQQLNPNTMLLSLELSDLVQNTMIETLQENYPVEAIKNLGHKTALFSVLVETQMPAVLFEIGFVSNPQEERQMRCLHYKMSIVEGLTKVILEWKERNSGI